MACTRVRKPRIRTPTHMLTSTHPHAQALTTRVCALRPLLLPMGEWALDEPQPPCDPVSKVIKRLQQLQAANNRASKYRNACTCPCVKPAVDLDTALRPASRPACCSSVHCHSLTSVLFVPDVRTSHGHRYLPHTFRVLPRGRPRPRGQHNRSQTLSRLLGQ